MNRIKAGLHFAWRGIVAVARGIVFLGEGAGFIAYYSAEKWFEWLQWLLLLSGLMVLAKVTDSIALGILALLSSLILLAYFSHFFSHARIGERLSVIATDVKRHEEYKKQMKEQSIKEQSGRGMLFGAALAGLISYTALMSSVHVVDVLRRYEESRLAPQVVVAPSQTVNP